MNIPLDAIAAFNTVGGIKPAYIRMEDEAHRFYIYKIVNIEFIKDENYSGVKSLLFVCNVDMGDCMKCIKIRYLIDTHKWLLVS